MGRKIICTIGPSCDNPSVLRRMTRLGMDIARLNLSHGTHALHQKRFKSIRSIDRLVSIMFDIQGPKIRLGKFEDPAEVILARGDIFVLTSRDVSGNSFIASVDYPTFPDTVAPKDSIFINDGLVELKVERILQGTDVVCRVNVGGEIGSGKGVNIFGKNISVPVPTEKDVADLKFVAKLKPDFVSVSFVSSAGDIARVRGILKREGADIPLIAKIERREAVENISTIIEESDGVMIARGDLAVEVSSEKVPSIQKKFIAKTNQSGKPVICATQMLESMRFHSRPTRAEASDVFNAVLDGADALMLSGETAIGAYPIGSLKMMSRLIREAERYVHSGTHSAPPLKLPERNTDLLGEALSNISIPMKRHRKNLKVIIRPVTSETLSFVSSTLSGFIVLAPTDHISLYRRMKIYGGILPVLVPGELLRKKGNSALEQEMRRRRFIKSRDRVLFVESGGREGEFSIRSVEFR